MKMLSFSTKFALITFLTIFVTTTADSNTFSPSCREAAPNYPIKDPEFDLDNLIAAYSTDPILNNDGIIKRHGKVFIVPINPENGTFLMDQKTEVINAKPVPHFLFKNGPEWGKSQRGSELFFTSFSEDECSVDECSVRLAKAKRNRYGSWDVEFLPEGDNKHHGFISQNQIDLIPKIWFRDLKTSLIGWRDETINFEDIYLNFKDGSGRWISSIQKPTQELLHKKIVINQYGKKITQTAIYNTQTRHDKVIFSDGRSRKNLFSWNAPELEGKTAIMTVVEKEFGGTDLETYKEDADGNWIIWNTIHTINPNYPEIYTPDPFVFKGKSYATMNSKATDGRSISWIASLDPKLNKIQYIISQESDTKEVSYKEDPEFLYIRQNNEVVIYYVDLGIDKKDRRLLVCKTGL